MENIFVNIYETAKKDNKCNDSDYGANKYVYDKLLELYETNV